MSHHVATWFPAAPVVGASSCTRWRQRPCQHAALQPASSRGGVDLVPGFSLGRPAVQDELLCWQTSVSQV